MPPPSPPPPSPPPPSPPPCQLPQSNYCIIVEGNAQLGSHTHNGPLAIGGTLTDGTPGETGPVAGHSFVGILAPGATFQWQNGVTLGQPLPVQFSDYVYVSSVIQQNVINNAGVWVVDQGGCYSESNAALRYWDLNDFTPGAQPQQGANGRRLVVFIGEGTVGIKGTVDNRQFGLSIMAPNAHVVIDATVGYVDGCVVAKSLSMTGTMGNTGAGAGVQFHCNCYNEPVVCPTGGAPPPPPCFDVLTPATCDRIASRNNCGRADAISGCRATCGYCGGCRIPGVDAPPPPPAQNGCFWPQQTDSYALITRRNAMVASHSIYRGMAIGGTLTDSTPAQTGSVGARSFITNIGTAERAFNWADGVSWGQPLPFDWSQFEELARALQPSPFVTIINQGGTYTGQGPPVATFSMDYFCSTTTANAAASACQAGASGYNMLVVFRGRGTIGLGGTASGRPFMGTVLAPWAHVVLQGTSSYIDGNVIAKSFESETGADQMHGYLYTGPLMCDRVIVPGVDCSNTKTDRFCEKRLSRGRCNRNGVRRKCARTCGVCGFPPPPAPPMGRRLELAD